MWIIQVFLNFIFRPEEGKSYNILNIFVIVMYEFFWLQYTAVYNISASITLLKVI